MAVRLRPENPTIKSGLVSITFRQLSAHQIVDLVAEAGQIGRDWGFGKLGSFGVFSYFKFGDFFVFGVISRFSAN